MSKIEHPSHNIDCRMYHGGYPCSCGYHERVADYTAETIAERDRLLIQSAELMKENERLKSALSRTLELLNDPDADDFQADKMMLEIQGALSERGSK